MEVKTAFNTMCSKCVIGRADNKSEQLSVKCSFTPLGHKISQFCDVTLQREGFSTGTKAYRQSLMIVLCVRLDKGWKNNSGEML